MNEIDVGVDFGITNSDIAIKSDGEVAYKSLGSEKNIHLSFNNIIKDLQRNSVIKSICVTGGKHLDLPENFDGLKVLKKECLMIPLQIIKMIIQSQTILTLKINNQNASNWMVRDIVCSNYCNISSRSKRVSNST